MESKFKPGWTALGSAKLLFENQDFNGAADRAYYAMHGIVMKLFIKAELNLPKTHHGVHVLFSNHFIKPGLIEAIYGENLSVVENIRLIADYSGDLVSETEARKAIDYAEKFVTRIDQYITNF